jgi:Flp pilus assembly protein TadD
MTGLILEAQGKGREAREAYTRALAADPNAAVAANNLAWLLIDDDAQRQEAVRLARIGQRSLRDQPEMNDTLGWALHRAGDSRAAVPHLRRATELRPESALYHYHLGAALESAGESAAARASLQRALKLDPSFPGHQQARAALGSAAPR